MSTRRGLVAASLIMLLLWPPDASGNGWEHGAIPFEVLLRALASDAPETRRRAAESLGFRGQRAAVEPLLARLTRSEPEPHVRGALYVALGRLGDGRAVPALTRCLDAESREELRGDCVTALGMIAETRTLPRLLQALAAESSFLVRSGVVDALGRFADPPALTALSSLVTSETNTQLRLRAFRALGRTRAAAATEPLLAALAAARDDTDRAVVVAALGDLKPREATRPLTTLLASTRSPELRARITQALGAIRDGDAYATLGKLLTDDVAAVRYFAIEGLRALGRAEAAVPIARLSLDISRRVAGRSSRELLSDLPRVRADLSLQDAAVRALTELDAPASVEALLSAAEPSRVSLESAEALALAEGIFEVRRAALVGLGFTRSRRAAAFLAGPRGAGDPDFRLRGAAVRSLGVLGFPDAVTRATAALADPAADVRTVAAVVLGRLRQRTAVAPLLRRLSDRDGEVRRQAALSLGYLGDAQALDRLRAVARDDRHEGVREAAAVAASLLSR
jgi:HEAT repeat protein